MGPCGLVLQPGGERQILVPPELAFGEKGVCLEEGKVGNEKEVVFLGRASNRASRDGRGSGVFGRLRVAYACCAGGAERERTM